MLLRTRLCWPPPLVTTPQNDPSGAFHLEWPRIAAFLETKAPGEQLCFQSLSLPSQPGFARSGPRSPERPLLCVSPDGSDSIRGC